MRTETEFIIERNQNGTISYLTPRNTWTDNLENVETYYSYESALNVKDDLSSHWEYKICKRVYAVQYI